MLGASRAWDSRPTRMHDDQIFDHKHGRQRSDDSGLASVCINGFEAGHSVGSIDVHGT